MTTHDLLRQIADGVAAQGKPGIYRTNRLDVGSAYRGSDGTKCVIGTLIDDAHYTPDLEGRTFDTLVIKAVEQSISRSLTHDEVEMLYAIQVMHDKLASSDTFTKRMLKYLNDWMEHYDTKRN